MSQTFPSQRLWGRALRQVLARWSRRRLAQLDGRIYLPGLEREVLIGRDQWGIPHITAGSRRDLFLAQGFVHAQDRLWQMELNRRAANGQLSAVFGPTTLATDRLAERWSQELAQTSTVRICSGMLMRFSVSGTLAFVSVKSSFRTRIVARRLSSRSRRESWARVCRAIRSARSFW